MAASTTVTTATRAKKPMTVTTVKTPTADRSKCDVLIIVDMQNDFLLPNGSLSLGQKGLKIIPKINRLREVFDKVVFTADWHPLGHMSFLSSHSESSKAKGGEGVPDLWADHCVEFTSGAALHSDMKRSPSDRIFPKGTVVQTESYSGFGCADKEDTGLLQYLKSINAGKVYVVGLCLDYCVGFTALDAAENGFRTYVVSDATAAITAEGETEMTGKLGMKGVRMIASEDVFLTKKERSRGRNGG